MCMNFGSISLDILENMGISKKIMTLCAIGNGAYMKIHFFCNVIFIMLIHIITLN